MKSVLISIQPKWCEFIASGEKTVEVRKTAPKLQTPFKCYIYCTKKEFDKTIFDYLGLESVRAVADGQGMIIGEFVCDRIEEFQIEGAIGVRFKRFTALAETCLSVKEMRAYAGIKPKLYGWHISDLKIYDKPKELGEFEFPADMKLCNRYDCDECENAYYKGKVDGISVYGCTKFIVTKPPQSYCYVEEM